MAQFAWRRGGVSRSRDEVDIDKAMKALKCVRPHAPGRMPLHMDEIYHAIVGMREAKRAKWPPELMEYWELDLAKSLERWRMTREEIDHE